MPALNGTGPYGFGPRTGRGFFGRCHCFAAPYGVRSFSRYSKKDELDYLKQEKQSLNQELQDIDKEIQDLQAQK
jgi:hypothetical protein